MFFSKSIIEEMYAIKVLCIHHYVLAAIFGASASPQPEVSVHYFEETWKNWRRIEHDEENL